MGLNEPTVGGLIGSALTLLIEARNMDRSNPEGGGSPDEFRAALDAAITSTHKVLEPEVILPKE